VTYLLRYLSAGLIAAYQNGTSNFTVKFTARTFFLSLEIKSSDDSKDTHARDHFSVSVISIDHHCEKGGSIRTNTSIPGYLEICLNKRFASTSSSVARFFARMLKHAATHCRGPHAAIDADVLIPTYGIDDNTSCR